MRSFDFARGIAAGLGAAAIATIALPRDAVACGGCFVPTENNTVVTDHRMILSIAQDRSTLYDQIRYQGDPASFAWVLPIVGTVDVGLSADVVFASLDAMTQVQVVAPPQNCPPPPNCDARSAANAGAPSAADSGGGVTVNKRETVGPYETVQLSATDAGALDRWLAQNGFVVPDDVKPVVARYVTEHFDFLAMKLVPGASVKSMRPVRVTTKGATPVLPLRMVAAGTGPVVGITLWIVGEGRYEPKNFPTFTIEPGELVWDWSAGASNYKALRDQKTAASSGRGWELESSVGYGVDQIRQVVENGGAFFGGFGGGRPAADPGQDYLPVPAADGGATIAKTAQEVRDEDLAVLLGSVRGGVARLTRARADLARAALSEDLLVVAPQEQGELARVRQVTREANQPQCPIWQGCEVIGQAPRDEAAAKSGSNGVGGSANGKGCSTTRAPAREGGLLAGAGAAVVAALGVIVAGRRRRPRG